MVAEPAEPVVDEIPQRSQRLLARHRPVKVVHSSRGTGPGPFHQRHDLPGDRVRDRLIWTRYSRRTLEGLAIVGVEIPPAAHRLAVAIDEHAQRATPLPIEVLHDQRLPPIARPLVKLLQRTGERPVRENLQRRALRCRRIAQRRGHPMVARLHDPHAGGLERADGASELRAQGLRIGAIAQLHVAHAIALLDELEGEVPHGGEEQGRALAVAGHGFRFGTHLGHQDGIAIAVQLRQGLHPGIQLIAQDHQQLARAPHRAVTAQIG